MLIPGGGRRFGADGESDPLGGDSVQRGGVQGPADATAARYLSRYAGKGSDRTYAQQSMIVPS
ncbi:hypothetical protein [Streptomyces sp. NBC_01233]|uniref:hypothetical protein n=1 Tax=Streptomyces sp. NBC_01233 TaxID=2903787 RepID=UPI002E10B533|nr:hypothetical protein OG332_01020 [Streptomyces sp. NBC_01233]